MVLQNAKIHCSLHSKNRIEQNRIIEWNRIHMNKTLYNTNMKYVVHTAVHCHIGRKSYCTDQNLRQKLLNSTMHTTYELPAEKISAE